ncbi:MAG: FAD-dependent oxidoreductase [bacterium]
METIKARLIETIDRTPSIRSFRLMPEERIGFLPGQFLQVIFDPTQKELNKYLSFSCSPTKEYIEFTKRLSSSVFSERLRGLKSGDEVLLKAPLGSCVFKEEYKKIAFLIGGIGITPVISILEYIADKGLKNDALLFYSNRTDEDIAFRKELDLLQSLLKNIRAFYLVTECEPRDKKCLFGRIDKELLIKEMNDYRERIFFIFGPPKMVEAMQGLCLDIGCKEENVKTENFIGY